MSFNSVTIWIIYTSDACIFFYPYNSANGINQQSVSLKIKRKLFFHVILVLCIMYYFGKLQSTVVWLCVFCLVFLFVSFSLLFWFVFHLLYLMIKTLKSTYKRLSSILLQNYLYSIVKIQYTKYPSFCIQINTSKIQIQRIQMFPAVCIWFTYTTPKFSSCYFQLHLLIFKHISRIFNNLHF